MKTLRYKTKKHKTRRGGFGSIFGPSKPDGAAPAPVTPPQKTPKNLAALNSIVGELEALTTKLKLEIGKSICE
jgi:hypothetical protein